MKYHDRIIKCPHLTLERHGWAGAADVFYTVHQFWYCECPDAFIQPASGQGPGSYDNKCPRCGAFEADSPDARADELLASLIAEQNHLNRQIDAVENQYNRAGAGESFGTLDILEYKTGIEQYMPRLTEVSILIKELKDSGIQPNWTAHQRRRIEQIEGELDDLDMEEFELTRKYQARLVVDTPEQSARDYYREAKKQITAKRRPLKVELKKLQKTLDNNSPLVYTLNRF